MDIGNGAVGNGNVTFMQENVVPKEELITSTFGEDPRTWTASNMINKCILTPKNHHTHLINDQITRQLLGEEQVYYSHDRVESDGTEGSRNYPTEFLNSINPSGLPPHMVTMCDPFSLIS